MANQNTNYQSDPHSAGFEMQWIHLYRDGDLREFKMLLPADKQTTRYLKELKDQALAEQEREALDEAKALEILNKLKKATGANPGPPPSLAGKKDTVDVAAERQSLIEREFSDSEIANSKLVPVYQWDEPLKLIENKAATPDSDVHKRNTEIFKQLKGKGHLRSIAAPIDHNDALKRLEQLRFEQPHFTGVIDLIQQQMVLATARALPLRLPPILLNGDPGVGKTFFTQALAAVLATPIRRHAFDSATTESALTGSDRNWSNTTYGLVFEMVCLGEAANPIVLLDELDKASRGYNRNPIAPLHTLLEPITAAKVTDISVGLTFDASHVMWIATANNPSRIPESIRSRFIEFDIQLPTGAHALQVARAVADSIHLEMALSDFEPAPAQIVKLLAHLVPREQGQVLRRAYASAIANVRTCIERSDLPADVLFEDEESPTNSKTGHSDRPAYFH